MADRRGQISVARRARGAYSGRDVGGGVLTSRLTVEGSAMPRTRLWLVLHAPAVSHAQDKTPARLDRFGDPLPPGVVARLGTVRFHRSDCAAYSPDGKFVVTGDGDGIYFWEAATGRKLRQLPTEDWGP